MDRVNKNNIAIVVTAFNRPNSLQRLLDSLNRAFYPYDVKLIISIDKSNNKDTNNENTIEVAKNFKWKFGQKELIIHEEHLGLKKHILRCGDLVYKYNNIIVLEDDLFVSPYFYNYVIKALDFFGEDENIAGISLYSPAYNEVTELPFIPLKSKFTNYFIQWPSSWGQAWNKKQWDSFINWFNNYNNTNLDIDNYIPQNVKLWSDATSWKKHFIRYMVASNKFFVYPYISFTTNFGDKGQHFEFETNKFQVEVCYQEPDLDSFCTLEETSSLYDVYGENISLARKFPNIPQEDLTIDIHGVKDLKLANRYILTSRELNYKKIRSYGMQMFPLELNVLMDNNGNGISLYDSFEKQKIKKSKKENEIVRSRLLNHYFSHLSGKDMKIIIKNKIIIIKNKIKVKVDKYKKILFKKNNIHRGN